MTHQFEELRSSLVAYPAGIQRERPADHLKRSSTAGPAPAPQRKQAEAADPQPTGARGAGVTQNWTSLSTKQNTPQEERRATSWT